MDTLLDIIEKLQSTEEALFRLENVTQRDPLDKTLLLELKSLKKRQQHLEGIFSELAHKSYLDVCTYRLFDDNGRRPKIASLTRALTDFQSLFTSVFNAVKRGPKTRDRISAEIAEQSAFAFGYTFVGSVGFALTIPNDRLMFGETELDKTMSVIFSLAKAENSESIVSIAQEIGIAPIRSLHQWAQDHVESALNAEIKWRRHEEVRAKLIIQIPELEHLQQTIDRTSEEEITIITVSGRLVGADVKNRTFHMTFEGAEDIRGYMDQAFPAQELLNLPKYYTASIRKITKTYYSTGQVETQHYLVSLS
ncbi:MAG: hypothetical protein HY208_05900 [Nitrospirae bacterium]|nr:hypothetical protein [Nitrospirota bacterium]